jgi:hypothetical protein
MKAYLIREVDNTVAPIYRGEILRAFAAHRPQLRPTEPDARNPLGLRRRRDADLLEHGQQDVGSAPFVAWLALAAIMAAVITFAAL